MRIAIVNDMKMAIEALRRAILSFPECEVAWIAENGVDAIKSCAADVPDLILMDILMPQMNGVDATREIMARSPCAILVVTASVDQNMPLVFQAMGAGALDAVSTPILGADEKGQGREDLLKKIKTIARLLDANRRVHPFKPKLSSTTRLSESWLIAMGASTGGPAAIANIISKFPVDMAAAVVVIQHVDANFAPGLAEWLSQQSVLPVKLAQEGDRIENGQILVAGTNDHLVIKGNGSLGYKREPSATPYRPSIDVFFESMLHHWPGHSVATLLTGMGRDGAEGLLRLRNDGVLTIAQSAETCAVYGMPKAAAELNAAVKILPTDDIAKIILSHMAIVKNRGVHHEH